MNWFKPIKLLENEMELTAFTLGPLLNHFNACLSGRQFAIKKSCSLALFHWMQLYFRRRKGLGRDSDLFVALHHQKISHGDDSGLKTLECCLLWKGSSVEQLLGKLCHTSSPAAFRVFWWKQKGLMPQKSMISLWALRWAPWEQEGNQPVKGAARH